MMQYWTYPEEKGTAALRTIVAFLNKRLADSSTVEWALQLNRTRRLERIAINDLLDNPRGPLPEPFATAWHLIQESWYYELVEDGSSTAIYGIQQRLRAGDRSGAIILAIVDLVAPRLQVAPIHASRWQSFKKPRKPKTFGDLLSASLTSGRLVDLNLLELTGVSEAHFLVALATAIDAAVTRGLDIARRIGWDGKRQLWRLGLLHRVGYTQPTPESGDQNEPDAYNRGIAPAVKLLDAVIARIAELDPSAASPFVKRWQLVTSAIHFRLWAASARNPQLVTADELAAFLLGLDDQRFWDLRRFPEVAELRALRFKDLSFDAQKRMVTRLRKGPPRNQWPKKAQKRHDGLLRANPHGALRWVRRSRGVLGVLAGRGKGGSWFWTAACVGRLLPRR